MSIWEMIRQAAAGDSPWTSPYVPGYEPGPEDDPGYEDFRERNGYRRLYVHNAAMRSLGLPESTSMHHFSPRMETGHSIGVSLRYPDERWHAQLLAPWSPNRDAHPLGAVTHLDLGSRDEDVPAALHQRLRHPEVMHWLRATMDPGRRRQG